MELSGWIGQVLSMEDSFRARVRAGDADAFGALFDEHARAIYRYACRMTGDPATAEDVVGQTFLEAWRLRRSVRAEGDSLEPWLYGIAINVLRNAKRSARRYRGAPSRMPDPEPAPDHAEQFALLAQEREELRAARAALLALKPAEREVVALCVWSGLSYAQAAEALGVPVGTVRSRLSRQVPPSGARPHRARGAALRGDGTSGRQRTGKGCVRNCARICRGE